MTIKSIKNSKENRGASKVPVKKGKKLIISLYFLLIYLKFENKVIPGTKSTIKQ